MVDDEENVARRAFARDESRLAGRAARGGRDAAATMPRAASRSPWRGVGRRKAKTRRTAEPLGRTEGVVGVPEHRVHGGENLWRRRHRGEDEDVKVGDGVVDEVLSDRRGASEYGHGSREVDVGHTRLETTLKLTCRRGEPERDEHAADIRVQRLVHAAWRRLFRIEAP